MLGKTYLRYVVGPQGGAIASSASLSSDAIVAPAVYGAKTTTGGARGRPAAQQMSSLLFVPSLEAVHVYSVRSGQLQHVLIPADAKMPLEVMSLRVLPLAPPLSSTSTTTAAQSILDDGWLLLVGYSNGTVAVFSSSPTNNYGKPVCRFHALGHKVHTAVLSLDADRSRSFVCSAGQDTDITLWDLVGHEAVCRLRGHYGGVVGLRFVPQDDNLLLSAAADGLVKVWNLALRQCVATISACDSQVSAMALDVAGRRLYCGLRTNHLKVYNTEGLVKTITGASAAAATVVSDSEPELVDHGVVARAYHRPVTSLSFSPDGAFLLACTSKTVEVFRALSADEVRRKVSRKRKRRRAGAGAKKAKAADEGSDADAEAEAVSDPEAEENEVEAEEGAHQPTSLRQEATAAEEMVLLRTYFMPDKVRSACFVPPPPTSAAAAADTLHISVTFANNHVKTYTTQLTTTEREGAATFTLEDLKQRHVLDQQGHQSDVRALAFVDNDAALVSLSREKAMLWTVSVKSDHLDNDFVDDRDFYEAKEANIARTDFRGVLLPVGSVALEEATSLAAISSSVCCVGQQDGSVLLVDTAAAVVVYSEPAIHTGGVKHVTRLPDDGGFLSVGADRRMLVWTVGVLEDQRTATLVQAQEVELTEFPLFATYSPDGRFLGVGLQNNNIQLFFADTLKPYLSLFGHKLPPTSLSFSSDGALVASVGMDKSLRFWGTDFGDCHRAIHAHDDYVTQVEFVKDTHYVFTVSMDGSVKHWDGDNWTMIQVLRQHQRGVWASAVTRNGTCVATAGTDKCIRCFFRSQDIVFPAEEEEKLAQEAMDEEAAKRAAMQKLDDTVDTAIAGQQTAATAEAAEKLMEALDLVSVERQKMLNPDDHAPRHPLLLNCTEWEYLWSVVDSIRPSELRHALLSLTSVHVDALLEALEQMLASHAVLNYETAARMVLALVLPTPGSSAAVANGLRSAAISGEVSEAHGARRLESLRQKISEGLDACVSRMDYNVAGLQMVRQFLEDMEKMKFFDLSKVQGFKKKYHSRALPSEKQ